MLSFANVFYLFANKLARSGRGRFSFSQILPGSINGFFVRHNSTPLMTATARRVRSAFCFRHSMSLEILDFPFMLFGLVKRCKCSQIAALARVRILLSRIQAELSGFEFANHASKDATRFRWVARIGIKPRRLRAVKSRPPVSRATLPTRTQSRASLRQGSHKPGLAISP
jgi:hypothetical protein